MKNRNGNIRTLLLMVVAALFVVSAIGVFAFLGSRGGNRHGITLPPNDWQSPEITNGSEEGFVTVTPENAPQIVENLVRPTNYHQSLRLTSLSNGNSGGQMTEIWAREGIWKIITRDGTQVRHILTDGKMAWLWYRDEPWRVETNELPQDISVDDLTGIPTYESIIDIPTSEILEAAYAPLSDAGNAPCLYVLSVNDSGYSTRYWVDLSTGLLTRADCRMEDAEIYRMEQTGLSVLEKDDETLAEQMLLPDGTNPFATAAAKTPQG